MRNALQSGAGYAVVGKDLACPHLAERGCELGLKTAYLGQDVVKVSILISSFDVVYLRHAQRVVGSISLFNGLLKESGSVRVDHDPNPCVEVVDSLPDLHRIIVEFRRLPRLKAKMGNRACKLFLCSLRNKWAYQRCNPCVGWQSCIEIHHENVEG